MTARAEQAIPRLSFSERHPGLSDTPDELFPKTIGIILGNPGRLQEFPTLAQRGFSLAFEYSDSLIGSVVLYADTKDGIQSPETYSAYLTTLLEGYLSSNAETFASQGIYPVSKVPKSRFSRIANETLRRIQRKTRQKRALNLYFVIENLVDNQPKSDILFGSEHTSPEIVAQLAGESSIQVLAGSSVASLKDSDIDETIKRFAKKN